MLSLPEELGPFMPPDVGSQALLGSGAWGLGPMGF